jgi:hypothetical protein
MASIAREVSRLMPTGIRLFFIDVMLRAMMWKNESLLSEV